MATVYTQTERSSGLYTATLTDENGAAIAALDSLVVWLRDMNSGAIINSRNNQSLLNVNGGAFSAGAFTWQMTPADHQILGTEATRVRERHQAVFQATWNGGANAKTWDVIFDVVNYQPIT